MRNKVEILLKIEKETEKGLLVSQGEEPTWLPKSQIDTEKGIENVGVGDEVVFSIPEWLAIDKGLV